MTYTEASKSIGTNPFLGAIREQSRTGLPYAAHVPRAAPAGKTSVLRPRVMRGRPASAGGLAYPDRYRPLRPLQGDAGAAPTSVASLELLGFSRPVDAMGGDYCTYESQPDGSLSLTLGDVTGHGLSAWSHVRALQKHIARGGGTNGSPAGNLSKLEPFFLDRSEGYVLMSCCSVLIDGARRELRYANAGHPPPYHYHRETGTLEKLGAMDPLLGANPTQVFRQRVRPWGTGDLLVLYTDGIPEARDCSRRGFGDERLRDLIALHANDALPRIRSAIVNAVLEHCGDGKPRDDQTLVLVKGL